MFAKMHGSKVIILCLTMIFLWFLVDWNYSWYQYDCFGILEIILQLIGSFSYIEFFIVIFVIILASELHSLHQRLVVIINYNLLMKPKLKSLSITSNIFLFNFTSKSLFEDTTSKIFLYCAVQNNNVQLHYKYSSLFMFEKQKHFSL